METAEKWSSIHEDSLLVTGSEKDHLLEKKIFFLQTQLQRNSAIHQMFRPLFNCTSARHQKVKKPVGMRDDEELQQSYFQDVDDHINLSKCMMAKQTFKESWSSNRTNFQRVCGMLCCVIIKSPLSPWNSDMPLFSCIIRLREVASKLLLLVKRLKSCGFYWFVSNRSIVIVGCFQLFDAQICFKCFAHSKNVTFFIHQHCHRGIRKLDRKNVWNKLINGRCCR